VFSKEARDRELFQLKEILRQLHHEFIPILKYYSIIASRLYHKAEEESPNASKQKAERVFTRECNQHNNP